MSTDDRAGRPRRNEVNEAEAWLFAKAAELPPIATEDDALRRREILRAVARTRPPGSWFARLAAWTATPLRPTPLGATAFALAMLAIGLAAGLTWNRWNRSAELQAHQPRGLEAHDSVRFTVTAPGARQVVLVGDFNDWDPSATPLKRTGQGSWAVELPLEPGLYHYSYLVDGKPRTAGDAPLEPSDGLGGRSAVVVVRGVAL